jgi:hypothetical protein
MNISREKFRLIPHLSPFHRRLSWSILALYL